MAHDAVLLEQIGRHAVKAHPPQFLDSWLNRFSALGAIAAKDLRSNRSAIDDNPIEQAGPCVFVNGANMIRHGIAVRLTGLRH